MEQKQKHLIFSFLLIIIFLTNLVYISRSEYLHSQTNSSKHFVLVHGAGHGGWCWYKLVPLLKSPGHKVTALDLGASGINPKQALEVPLITQYFSPLTEFMASLSPQERVILVGHSYGGLALTYAMEKFPGKISAAVFVTALMPAPFTNFTVFIEEVSRSLRDSLDNTFTFENGASNPPTTSTFGPRFLATKLYQLSPIQDWTLATLLVRPLYSYSDEDLQRTLMLSPNKYGSVNRIFIMINQDKVIDKYFQDWMIKQNPLKQVGEIKGSDHMVMISKPDQLFRQLQDIAQKYS